MQFVRLLHTLQGISKAVFSGKFVVDNRDIFITDNLDKLIEVNPVPELPTENYFIFTNRGASSADVLITSRITGYVFINDMVVGTTGNTYSVPANGIIKVVGLRTNNDSSQGCFQSITADANFSIDRWDESVTSLDNMFVGDSGIKRISSWDGAQNYTTLNNTFYNSSVETIDTWSGLNSLTKLDSTFSNSNLTTIPASWSGLDNVTQMNSTFENCTSLVTGGDNSISSLSNIRDFSRCFYRCSSWTGDGFSIYDYLSTKPIEVTSYSDTFTDCTNCIGYNDILDTWGGGLSYNPLNLPAYTIRLKYNNGVTPTFSKGTATQVSSSPNVWDLTYNNSNWNSLLKGHTDLIEVLGANTENITSMDFAFRNCSNLKEVQLFDIGRIGSLRGTFLHCTSLTAVPKFNTRNLYSFESTFSGCSSLTTVPLFDTSNVTNMSEMFRECTSLINVPLFDTKNVREMITTFYECSSLTTIPLFDTRSLTTLFCTFSNCSSLVSIPLLNTSNVHEFTGAFGACTSLITVPLFDTHNAITFNTMFNGCTNLTSIPVFDSSKVTDMDWMFCGCSSLKEVPLLDTGKVTTIDLMFRDCVNVEHGALALYNQVSSQMNPPSNHSMTFFNCGSNTQTGAAELAQIPSGWK